LEPGLNYDMCILARASNIAPNRHAVHPFDLKYGTDTGGYLRPDELGSGGIRSATNSDAMNNGYSAVAPSVFREACRRWRETLPSAARLAAYSFVDVGAGKGRALLLAAELPFRKVIGVELSEALAHIAQKNVTLWKRIAKPRAKIRVVHEDAAEFRWPRTPLLVYLNNPFDCALVEQLAHHLATVAASGPGLVDLLYVNPACADTLTRTGAGSTRRRHSAGFGASATWSPPKEGFFKLLWNAQIQMDEADQQADPYGAISDRVSAFRYCANLS
jgi:SAM-dependent methyltransferase